MPSFNIPLELIEKEVAASVSATTTQQKQLSLYIFELLKWNETINLTAVRSPDRLLASFILESSLLASFLTALPFSEHARICDLGAGAGLPGIPLRIFSSKGIYTLIEIRQKRAIFLSHVLSKLALPRTYLYHGSFEEYFAHHEKADLLLSKAFMPWPRLLTQATTLLAPSGILLILAREEPPKNLLPWRLIQSEKYQILHKDHWFWALQLSECLSPRQE